jgi:uncharacterized protein (DUF2249 family)
MDTVLDFRAFDARFKSGLLFSITEGLLQGKEIKIIFDHDPDYLHQQFEQAKIPNSQWQSRKIDEELWEVRISKNNQQQQKNCCGVCGNG